jgi:hypothetical protein
MATPPTCKCDCQDSESMNDCISETFFNVWNKTSCDCFFNPFTSLFGKLFDNGFSFTNLVRTIFDAGDDYDEE